MSDPNDPDFDLDEDLFGFDPIPESEAWDELNLDLVFSEFESLERERELQEALAQAETHAEAVEGELETAGAAAAAEPETEQATPAPAAQAEAEVTPSPKPAPQAGEPKPAKAPRAPKPEKAQPQTAPPVTATDGKRRLLSRRNLALLVAMTSINILVATVTLLRAPRTSPDASTPPESGTAPAQTAALSLDPSRRSEPREVTPPLESELPTVAPSAEAHPTLDRAHEDIENGEFGVARRRIYALLAIIDRVESDTRSEVEGRAQYLLAEAAHLEAMTQLEQGS